MRVDKRTPANIASEATLSDPESMAPAVTARLPDSYASHPFTAARARFNTNADNAACSNLPVFARSLAAAFGNNHSDLTTSTAVLSSARTSLTLMSPMTNSSDLDFFLLPITTRE